MDQEPGSSGILSNRPENQETGMGSESKEHQPFIYTSSRKTSVKGLWIFSNNSNHCLKVQAQEIQVAFQGTEGGPSRRTSNAEPQAWPTTYPKWSHTVPHHGSQGGGKGWMPAVSQDVPTGWTPIELPSASCLFCCEFKKHWYCQ